MRRTFLLLAVSAAVAAAFACGSDYGADAPVDAVDAGDASVQQVADASDGGTDATDAASFCATRTGAVYCEDFDSLLDVKTLVPETSAKSAVGLTQGQFVSPSRSLSFSTSTDEPSSFAVFKHPVVGDRAVRLELDMFFDQLESTPQTLQSITLTRKNAAVSLGRVCNLVDGGPLTCGVLVAVCLFDSEAVTTACTTHAVPVTKAFTSVGTWSHVALEASFAQAGRFELEVDHAVVLALDTATYGVGAPPADAPTIATVGIAALQGNPTLHLLVDNVVITLP
jgi:hypothetical protein